MKLRATKLTKHYFTTLTLTLQHESLKMVSIVFCSDIKRPTGSPKQFRGFQIDDGILQFCEFQVPSVRSMSSIFDLAPNSKHICLATVIYFDEKLVYTSSPSNYSQLWI